MEKEYLKVFSENLRELIGDMSVYEFSKRVGIPNPTVIRYLHCQRQISLDNLIKIADFFHEDIDFLIGRKQY